MGDNMATLMMLLLTAALAQHCHGQGIARVVGSKPSFSSSPSSSTVYIILPSATLPVTCAVTGAPTPVITWLRNNDVTELVRTNPRPSVSGTGTTLTFQPIGSLAEAYNVSGWYTCQATNKYGSIFADFAVVAFVAPDILHHPSSLSTGSSTTLNQHQAQMMCLASGIPKPTYEWYLNSKTSAKLISTGSISIITLQSGHSLITYKSLTSGTFYCKATNVGGSVWSNAGSYISTSGSSSFAIDTRLPLFRTYSNGSRFSMNCDFDGMAFNGSVDWFFKGIQINNSGRISISNTMSSSGFFAATHTYRSSLAISSLTDADSGVYSCASRIGSAYHDRRCWAVGVQVPPSSASVSTGNLNPKFLLDGQRTAFFAGYSDEGARPTLTPQWALSDGSAISGSLFSGVTETYKTTGLSLLRIPGSSTNSLVNSTFVCSAGSVKSTAVVYRTLLSCTGNWVFNGEAGFGKDGWQRGYDSTSTTTTSATTGNSRFVLKPSPPHATHTSSFNQRIDMPDVAVTNMNFRMLVRQSTTVSGAALPAPEMQYQLNTGGGTVATTSVVPTTGQLANTGWYWMQWSISSAAKLHYLNLILTASAPLKSWQQIYYDQVCVSITSAMAVAPTKTQYNSTLFFIINDCVLLRCPILGFPLPSVTWTISSQETGADQIRDSGALKLCNLQAADATVYTCSATNTVNSTAFSATADFILRIHGATATPATPPTTPTARPITTLITTPTTAPTTTPTPERVTTPTTTPTAERATTPTTTPTAERATTPTTTRNTTPTTTRTATPTTIPTTTPTTIPTTIAPTIAPTATSATTPITTPTTTPTTPPPTTPTSTPTTALFTTSPNTAAQTPVNRSTAVGMTSDPLTTSDSGTVGLPGGKSAEERAGGLSTPAIGGIAGGGALLLFLMIVCILHRQRQRRLRRQPQQHKSYFQLKYKRRQGHESSSSVDRQAGDQMAESSAGVTNKLFKTSGSSERPGNWYSAMPMRTLADPDIVQRVNPLFDDTDSNCEGQSNGRSSETLAQPGAATEAMATDQLSDLKPNDITAPPNLAGPGTGNENANEADDDMYIVPNSGPTTGGDGGKRKTADADRRTRESDANDPFIMPSSEADDLYVVPTSEADDMYVVPTSEGDDMYVVPTSEADDMYVAPTSKGDDMFIVPTSGRTNDAKNAAGGRGAAVPPITDDVYIDFTEASNHVPGETATQSPYDDQIYEISDGEVEAIVTNRDATGDNDDRTAPVAERQQSRANHYVIDGDDLDDARSSAKQDRGKVSASKSLPQTQTQTGPQQQQNSSVKNRASQFSTPPESQQKPAGRLNPRQLPAEPGQVVRSATPKQKPAARDALQRHQSDLDAMASSHPKAGYSARQAPSDAASPVALQHQRQMQLVQKPQEAKHRQEEKKFSSNTPQGQMKLLATRPLPSQPLFRRSSQDLPSLPGQ